MALPARIAERIYTIEEFERLPEFGERYELIDGKLVEKPIPGGEHGLIVDNIRDAIKAFDSKKKLGYSLQETSVRLGPNSSPIPDVSYWKAERNIKPDDQAMPIPDLAVEVLSPSDVAGPVALKSAMVKVKKLVNAGVAIVWVVNPKTKVVEVYHTGQPEQPIAILGEQEELEGEGIIPGFKLRVGELFEE